MTCVKQNITNIIADLYGEKWAKYFVHHLFMCIIRGQLRIIQDGDIFHFKGYTYRVIKALTYFGKVECLETGEIIEKFVWLKRGRHVEIDYDQRLCGSKDNSFFKSPHTIRDYLIRVCPKAPRHTVNRALKIAILRLRFFFITRNEWYEKNVLIECGGETYRVIENYGYSGKVYCYNDDKVYTEFRWQHGTTVPKVIGVDKTVEAIH